MTSQQKKVAKEKLGLKWDFILIQVGRNTNRKQLPRLINAFKEFWIRNDRPFNVGMILHVGDPTDTAGMGGWNLPQLIKEAGLDKQIAFSDTTTNPLFGLSREELAMLYGLADVHVMATGGEGFGVPTAEAMACGTPIILPDNSTGPELVGDDDERGWLVPCATHIVGPKWGVNLKLVDESALADAIQDAYDHPELVKSKGEAARNWAVENLSWDILTDQLEELIHTVAESEHPLGENAEMNL
jgi:glycosyltransferase involved in cell wall biosynthesis